MRRTLPGLLVFVLLYFMSVSVVYSSGLVLINKKGEVIVKVLGITSGEKMKIVGISTLESSNGVYSNNAQVSLTLTGEDVRVDIKSADGVKTLNATDWDEEIVEIEERGDVKKISIQRQDNSFLISQGVVVAKTQFPIVIDSKRGELSVITATGSRHILRYPQDVAETLKNTKIVSLYDNIKITERENGELIYEVKGEKAIKILGLFNVRGNVDVDVSASSGEVLTINEPLWLKILGLIFI